MIAIGTNINGVYCCKIYEWSCSEENKVHKLKYFITTREIVLNKNFQQEGEELCGKWESIGKP